MHPSSLVALLLAGPLTLAPGGVPAPAAELDRAPSRVLWLPEISEDDAAFEALAKEFKAAQFDWRRARRAARKEGTRFEEPDPVNAFLPRFAELEDSPGALLWVGLNADSTSLPRPEVVAHKRRVFARLAKDFADHGVMEDFVKKASRQRGFVPPAELVEWLTPVFERHGDTDVRARAAYEIAQALSASADKKDHAAAEEWCRRIVREFPGSKMARRAQDSLDVMNFQVGRVAPDFTTQDVDGNEFKLSDYRGKVVVLDFWGFW